MPAHRLLPDSDTLLKLRRQGWSYQDIANEYGVTQGAVYWQLRDAKGTTARPRYDDLIPWRVAKGHEHAQPALMLRLLGRRQAGQPIPLAKERRLDKWLRELREADVVVCYEADMPPNPASPTVGGWYYSKRRPEDGEGVIRRPKESV